MTQELGNDPARRLSARNERLLDFYPGELQNESPASRSKAARGLVHLGTPEPERYRLSPGGSIGIGTIPHFGCRAHPRGTGPSSLLGGSLRVAVVEVDSGR